MENKTVLFLKCDECGEKVSFDIEEISKKAYGKTLCSKCMEIRELKLFAFENGETDWVIAKDLEEAKEYYATDVVGFEEIEEFTVSEVSNWHDIEMDVETDKQQGKGTYLKKEKALNVAKEMYGSGYNGATVFASTCV